MLLEFMLLCLVSMVYAAMSSQHAFFVENEGGINLIVFTIYLEELNGRMGLNSH